MRAMCLILGLWSTLAGFGLAKGGNDKRNERTPPADGMTAEKAASPLDFTVRSIDGQEIQLSRFKGDVILIVNVASKCGYTPQYKQLQQVYDRYKEKGFRILAFPANDFMGQEPGTNEEIKAFCERNYNVTFDLFEKVAVTGNDASELYKFLTSPEKTGEFGKPIGWNFTKYLVDREGKVIARFETRVRPDDKRVIEAIEKALEAKRPN